MAVVFDSDVLAVADRADALVAAMEQTSVASFVGPRDRDDIVARLDTWTFGVAGGFRAELSGIQLSRTAKQTRTHPTPNLAIAVQEIGVGLFDVAGEQRVVGTMALQVIDENSPYEFHWVGRGASQCLFVPLNDVGLPSDLIRAASARLHASPICQLMINHITGLFRQADALSDDPAAAGVGVVSVELTRALLTSAAGENRYRRDALAATLLTQIRGYVRAHLTDSDLTPESIAAEHNISVRYLYKLCSDADFSLHQWVRQLRLQGARDELAGTASQYRSIAMIAQRWGFSNPTHFSRRFRAAYGMTPRDWRNAAASGETV